MANGYRLLVVEDDVALCESIADVLRFAGYDVTTAEDGDTALQVLRDAPRPDAILLDMVLPRMSAQRVLERLGTAEAPSPRVLLMTGMPRRPEAGDDLLLKPFDIEELLARVATACRAPAPEQASSASPA